MAIRFRHEQLDEIGSSNVEKSSGTPFRPANAVSDMIESSSKGREISFIVGIFLLPDAK